MKSSFTIVLGRSTVMGTWWRRLGKLNQGESDDLC